MKGVMLDPTKHWECPSCGLQHVTRQALPHTPLHGCGSLNGLSVPYVEVMKGKEKLTKFSVRHVLNEREDFIGKEQVTYHEGRPIMNLSTERADGSNDLRVYAPTAQVNAL